MIFIAVFLAVIIVYLIQVRIFTKHTFENLDYDVKLSTEEVFEGEDIFMYEEITNNKSLPIPSAKVDTELPDGLNFRLIDPQTNRDVYQKYIQSVFVLGNKQKVKRRWRVTCRRRGVYTLGSVIVITNDLLGFNAQSKRFDVPPSKYNKIVVLPKTLDLNENFISSYYQNGETPVVRSLMTDPIRLCGTREYTPYDPMNRINWKSTAVHGKLMVNIEENTQRHQFNIIINMQSRDIENVPHVPSTPEYNDQCITVCASILDQVSSENVSVRVFINTPPESLKDNIAESAGSDDIGSQILMTRAYRGKTDIIEALRLLAEVKHEYSCPIENMLDHIAANSQHYANGGNIVVVSPYVSERMIIFHNVLRQQGIRVVFFVTTTYQNAMIIPEDVEVFYKTNLN